jgi:Protein phosphatase 2C
MLTHVNTFWVPKRGSSLSEYEDAFWVSPDGSGNGEIRQRALTVAVADGASESLLAGRWARRLTAVFGSAVNAACGEDKFAAAYSQAALGWDEEVLEYTLQREERGAPIQWYEEPGLAKGAYATILVVEFRDAQEEHHPMWKAAAVGDSCLFQVRDEALYASFPVDDPTAFSYQPSLLPSRGVEGDTLYRHIELKQSDWERGDSFYLATDALAAWFLRAVDTGHRPWEPLRDLDTLDAELDFAEWVDRQRDLGEMHNDDTTLVRIDMI